MGQEHGVSAQDRPAELSLMLYRALGSSGRACSGVACEHALGTLVAAWACAGTPGHTHSVDGLQRGEEPLLMVCSLLSYRESRLRLCRSWNVFTPQAVDLVGIEEAADRREAADLSR